MPDTTGQQSAMPRARPDRTADTPTPTVRVMLRVSAPVATLISASFLTMHKGGEITHAGILSMLPEEWNSPAWRRIRDACDVVEDIRGP